jgi:hypothetical protein
MYEDWIDPLLVAARNAGLSLEVLHIIAAHDESTKQEALSQCSSRGIPLTILESKEPDRDSLTRVWNEERYRLMAALRETCLDEVRRRGPDWWLSIDSDALLAPDALVRLLACMDRYDVTGARCYMSPPPGREFPSYGHLKGNALWNRTDATEGDFPVPVVMAVKLFSPKAYEIAHYESHPAGEDVGFSKLATAAGLRLGWCADARVKHVMAPEYLSEVDPRVGF